MYARIIVQNRDQTESFSFTFNNPCHLRFIKLITNFDPKMSPTVTITTRSETSGKVPRTPLP